MTRQLIIKSRLFSKFAILSYLIVTIVFANLVHTDDQSELNTAYTVDQTNYIPTSVSYSGNNNGALTKSTTTTYYSSSASGYPYGGGAVPIGGAPYAQPILQPQQLVVNPQPIPQALPYAQSIPQPIPAGGTIAQPIPQVAPYGGQPIPQALPYAQPIPVGGVYGGGAAPYAQPLITQQPIPQPIPQAAPYAPYAQPIYGGGGGGGGVVYGGGIIAQPTPTIYSGGGVVYGGGGGVIAAPYAQPIPQSAPIIYSGGCDIYGGGGCGGGVVYGGGGGGIYGGSAVPIPQALPITGGVVYGGGGGIIAQPTPIIYSGGCGGGGCGGGVVYGGGGGGIYGGGAVPIQPFSVDTIAPVSLMTYPSTALLVNQPAAATPCSTGKCSQSSIDTYVPNVVVPASVGTVTAGTKVVGVPLKSSNVVVGSGSTASSCLLAVRGLTTLALSPTSSVCSSVVSCMITYISNYVQYAINALNFNSSTTLTVNSQDENVDLWKALENIAGSISEDGYGPATATTATATSSACTNDLSPVFARTAKSGAVYVNSCWARMAKASPPFVPVTLKPGSVSSGGKFDWPDDVQNPNYVVANYYVLSAFRLTNFLLYYFRPCMSTSTYTVLSSALQSLSDISALITAGNISSANSLLSDLQTSLSQLTSA